MFAFVGRPHRIDDRDTTQVRKWLKEIGCEAQILAEQTGWVLFLECSTDLAILRAFAELLDHPARDVLASPFVHYAVNHVSRALGHFHGVREAKPDLAGIAVLDRDERSGERISPDLNLFRWQRREIENYLCQPATLEAYGMSLANDGELPLFAHSDAERARAAMWLAIEARQPPAALGDLDDPYWHDTKVSEQLLDLVFAAFFEALELPNLMRRRAYHELARFVPPSLIDPEVRRALDAIVGVASTAKPSAMTVMRLVAGAEARDGARSSRAPEDRKRSPLQE